MTPTFQTTNIGLSSGRIANRTGEHKNSSNARDCMMYW